MGPYVDRKVTYPKWQVLHEVYEVLRTMEYVHDKYSFHRVKETITILLWTCIQNTLRDRRCVLEESVKITDLIECTRTRTAKSFAKEVKRSGRY